MSKAILGGLFDPTHNLHLAIAAQAINDYELEKVIFVPANIPPHKSQPLASPEHRLAMLKLAIDNNPDFEISTIELERGGLSYTVDTLKILRPEYLILGEDAYRQLDTWKEPDTIRDMVDIIVIPRIDPLSSTMLREKLKAGKPVSVWLTPRVEEYIKEHRLYTD
ncbi:MAG: nicotinate (nicotinamide) nucleotide adenylyltransferase [Candidatus Margulisiibacteriota bacterium]